MYGSDSMPLVTHPRVRCMRLRSRQTLPDMLPLRGALPAVAVAVAVVVTVVSTCCSLLARVMLTPCPHYARFEGSFRLVAFFPIDVGPVQNSETPRLVRASCSSKGLP